MALRKLPGSFFRGTVLVRCDMMNFRNEKGPFLKAVHAFLVRAADCSSPPVYPELFALAELVQIEPAGSWPGFFPGAVSISVQGFPFQYIPMIRFRRLAYISGSTDFQSREGASYLQLFVKGFGLENLSYIFKPIVKQNRTVTVFDMPVPQFIIAIFSLLKSLIRTSLLMLPFPENSQR